MSNKKQSSVDWLINQALEWSKEIGTGCHYMKFPSEALEQAKSMHKEEIMEAHYAPKYGCFSEQYYNETYGGNNDNP